MLGYLFGWVKEFIFVFIYLLAGLLGFIFPLGSLNKNPTRKYSFVFVHGWLTQNPLYWLLKHYLEHHGYLVYMTNLGLQAGDFRISAKRLKAYMDARELRDVILIGVSGGAIISFYYLQRLDGWHRVLKFISIGGPFRGSPLAVLAFFSKGARQMIPDSPFIQELFEDGVTNIGRIVCLYTKHDELVPRWSSQLDGANNICIDTIGHVNFQAFCRQTYGHLAEQGDIAHAET